LSRVIAPNANHCWYRYYCLYLSQNYFHQLRHPSLDRTLNYGRWDMGPNFLDDLNNPRHNKMDIPAGRNVLDLQRIQVYSYQCNNMPVLVDRLREI
jgi:hypothetical protein